MGSHEREKMEAKRKRKTKDGEESSGERTVGRTVHTQPGTVEVIGGILGTRRPTRRDRWSRAHLNHCHCAWLDLTGLAGVLWLGNH